MDDTECSVLDKFTPATEMDDEDIDKGTEGSQSLLFGRSDETADDNTRRCPSPEYDIPWGITPAIDIPLRNEETHYSVSAPAGLSQSSALGLDMIAWKRQLDRECRSPLMSPPPVSDRKRCRRLRCPRCKSCLMDLKRQALLLVYPHEADGEKEIGTSDCAEKLEEKLRVSEDFNNFAKNGDCSVCDSRLCQLKLEAASMVLSLQQTQGEAASGRSGTSPASVSQRRGCVAPAGSHLRYARPGKSAAASGRGGNSLIPVPSRVQTSPWSGSKQPQMLLRGSSQDKTQPQTGEMHPGMRDQPPGQYGLPPGAQYGSPSAQYLSAPYMQQTHPMQQFHQQQQYMQYKQQQQQQQQQQHHQHSMSQAQQMHPQYQPPGQPQYQQYQYQQMYQPVQHQQLYQAVQNQQQFYPAASSSPSRIASPPPGMSRIASPPPGMSRIASPPPGMARIASPPPGLSRISSPPPSRVMSPMSPPPMSPSAAASFFTRAAQKLSKKKRRHQHQEPEPPPFPTAFHQILRLSPPPCPPCLLRNVGRLQVPGVGKVKVMLRVIPASAQGEHGDQSSSFLNIDTRNKQVTVFDPSASGYPTSLPHRKATMAPKMFAFDNVFSPDDSLTEVCASTLTDILQGVVAGADGCLFTYGYSRLGKTYTIIGKDESPQTLGIVPCAISWLFKLISEQKDQTGARFSVRVSAVEVSGKQEVLKDLLADVAQGTETGVGTAPGVYLREDPISGTQLENQSELRAPSADRAAYYLDAALAARTQTDETEGRASHLLFTIHVYQYRIEKANRAGLPGVAGGRSRLHLIDLGSSSKSKDPDHVALSLSGLGNVIMALLNGQRHVPHRDSKVAQLLRDSLGNISCRTCMIAHVSSAVPHYNESLQVIQLAARIHRMRRRKTRFSSTSSDDSSTDDGRIRTRPLRGLRMGTLREDVQHGTSLSDPDYTSSSEQSCDTVIYLGVNGQSLSDRELTDHEGPPRSVPRTNPRLPRRASGSRSSGDEGSNSDSGRSMYTSRESLTRIPARLGTPVRDVSVTGSRHGTPVRDVHQGSHSGTPIRDLCMDSLIQGSPPPGSPPSPGAVFLPRKSNIHSRMSPAPNQDGGSNMPCYPSVSVLEKAQPRGSVRTKRSNSESASTEQEQWIDGPGAAIYPDNKKAAGEQWVDGPPAFVVKTDAKKFKQKISSEELWVDGPQEMIAEPEKKAQSPNRIMHTTSKKAHVRSLSQEKKGSPKHQTSSPEHQASPTHHHRHASPEHQASPTHHRHASPEHQASPTRHRHTSPEHQASPTQHHRHTSPEHVSSPSLLRAAAKPAWLMQDIKERPESTISLESNTSNTAQAPDSRPTSMITNTGDIEEMAAQGEAGEDTAVKPFVRDWVEKHGVKAEEEQDTSLGFIMNADNQVIGTLETAASYRRPKPQDARTKKLAPLSSTPKHTPHHSPRNSPSVSRKPKPTTSTPKLLKSQLPAAANPSKRVTDWLKSVEGTEPGSTIRREEGEKSLAMKSTDLNTEVDPEFEMIVANLDMSQDISACSTVYLDPTLSQTSEDTTEQKKCEQSSGFADVSFDSSADTAISLQNRESIYELQMDAELEKALEENFGKPSSDVADDETFSNASCKDSDMDVAYENPSDSMKKSDTIQSIRTLVGDLSQDNSMQQKSDSGEKSCSIDSELALKYDELGLPQPLSRKPDGASNPNLLVEGFIEKSPMTPLHEELYQCAAVLSSQVNPGQKSLLASTSFSKSNTLTRTGEGDGQNVESMWKEKADLKTSSKPPIPQKVCSKCGFSQQSPKQVSASKMCKDCQKAASLAAKTSSLASSRKDKPSKKDSVIVTSSGGSPTSQTKSSSSKSSKSQSPSHSRLPIFSSKNSQSLKEAKANRKKEKESKRLGIGRVGELVMRSPGRGHDSDSGNDSGICAMEKNLLSPYATVTKPRTVSHSSSGHGSDNSSNVSTDLHSKQGSVSDKLHGGTSSGYESMLRDSEVSGSSTAHEDSASEMSSGEKKKGSKKKRLPSTRRSRSAPARSSESPDSSSRKSSPSSKNSSLSPASKGWLERHKTKDEPIEIKDYDAEDVKRLQRHRNEEEPQTMRRNHDRIKEILTKPDQELPGGKDQYIVDRSNWSFDCKFLMCFSCRSRPRKTDV